MSGQNQAAREPGLVARIYDSVAARYDAYYSDPSERAENKVIAGLIDRLPYGPMLDLGCGTGLTLDLMTPRRRLRQWADGYVGVDASLAMLARAQGKHPQFIFRQGDMHVPGYTDARSTVCLFAAYLGEPWLLIRVMAQQLGPDGRALIITPTINRDRYGHDTIDGLYGTRPTALEWGFMARRYFSRVSVRGLTRWPLPWPLKAAETMLPGDPDKYQHLIVEAAWPIASP